MKHNTELANKIIMYRARHNISQVEMAKRCNVTAQTISNIETGVAHPSKITVIKIKNIIGE